MPSLPLPLVTALVLGFLLLRSIRHGGTPLWLRLFIGACILQSVVIALHHHYGISALRPVQPVTAILLPPLALIAFETTAVRPFSARRHLPHLLLAPLAIALITILAPRLIDPAVPLIFAGYGLAMLHELAGGTDSLPRTRLESGEVPALIWRLIAATFLLSTMSDLLIFLDMEFAGGRFTPWVVGVFHGLLLLTLGGLGLSSALESPADTPGEPETIVDMPPDLHQDREKTGEDHKLTARLEQLMTSERSYLDEGLTLARLARRLGVPAKRLSAAINRVHGENVSRHVNRHRIDHACRLLEEGASVTTAMLESGFVTKSNFNREFKRLKGMAPSGWAGK
ncbi:MAG: helix-turn-helix domain-containing protein [Geminicoccaceae bacterium]